MFCESIARCTPAGSIRSMMRGKTFSGISRNSSDLPSQSRQRPLSRKQKRRRAENPHALKPVRYAGFPGGGLSLRPAATIWWPDQDLGPKAHIALRTDRSNSRHYLPGLSEIKKPLAS
jgi:hypothetical protein